jgi:hypothetical protein
MKPEISESIAKAARMRGFVLAGRAVVVFLFAVVLLVASAHAQQVYVVTSNQQFGTVDLASGAFHQIGANTPEGQANLVWGPQGRLYSLTFSGNLEKIDPATGATSVVGATGLGLNAFDLAGVRGQLFVTDFSNNIYSVNADTGAATLLAATGMPPDPAIPFTFNADGTMNLCDESLYGIGGGLYAIFDSFTLDPGTLAINPTVPAGLYRIDPSSGLATYIAPTDLNLGSMVDVAGNAYAFKWITTAFTDFGPQVRSVATRLDLSSGATIFVSNVDSAAGGITGAAPVFGRR